MGQADSKRDAEMRVRVWMLRANRNKSMSFREKSAACIVNQAFWLPYGERGVLDRVGGHDGLRFSLFDDHFWPIRLVVPFMFRFSQIWRERAGGVGSRGLKVTSVVLDLAPFQCLSVSLSFSPRNEMPTVCCPCALGLDRSVLCWAEGLGVVSNPTSEEQLSVSHQRRLMTSAAGFAARR